MVEKDLTPGQVRKPTSPGFFYKEWSRLTWLFAPYAYTEHCEAGEAEQTPAARHKPAPTAADGEVSGPCTLPPFPQGLINMFLYTNHIPKKASGAHVFSFRGQLREVAMNEQLNPFPISFPIPFHWNWTMWQVV